MTTTIRMSEREKQLTQASDAGRKCFKYNWGMGDMMKGDPALKQAWENGYRIAKEEAIADHRIGYR
jgi:hypothetical protein